MLLYRKIDHPEDYVALQMDINSVNNWIKGNYLRFNACSSRVEDNTTVAGKKFGELLATLVKTKIWRKKFWRFHTASFVYACAKTELKKLASF